MNSKLFIAEKVKVGFNPRTDTYSGKLGYVIGHDGKKWRKEPSWDGWRYHHMDDATYQQKRLEQYNDRVAKSKKDHAYYVEESSKNSPTGNLDKKYFSSILLCK
jgi:predicted PolB exonuclease-like 3'-5' exonuclease